MKKEGQTPPPPKMGGGREIKVNYRKPHCSANDTLCFIINVFYVHCNRLKVKIKE